MTAASPIADSAGGARQYTAWLLCAGGVTGALVLGATLLAAGGGEEGWNLAARHTARVAALWFLMVFAVGPLARLLRTGRVRWLLRERRGLGLAFFAAHTVHLGAIIGVLRLGEGADAATLAGGGLAYLLLFAMAATSNDAAVRRLGAKRWRVLHSIGIHYLWLIFFLTYLGRIEADAPGIEHWLLIAAFSGLLLWRVVAGVSRRRVGVGR